MSKNGDLISLLMGLVATLAICLGLETVHQNLGVLFMLYAIWYEVQK